MKNKLQPKRIFYLLITIFVLIIAYFFILNSLELHRSFFLVLAVLGILFLALGIVLVVISRKEKKKLRLFLRLTGIAAILPFAFTILHNLFYGLGETFLKLKFIFEPLHVVSFLISLILAPILFIIGVIGT